MTQLVKLEVIDIEHELFKLIEKFEKAIDLSMMQFFDIRTDSVKLWEIDHLISPNLYGWYLNKKEKE